MLYYQHDSDAFFDEKITDLFAKYGYEGLGYFYTLLEKLSRQEKPIRKDILKMMLIKSKRNDLIFDFLLQVGLISESSGQISNRRLLADVEIIQSNRKTTSKRVQKHRNDNQQVTPEVTGYNGVTKDVTPPLRNGHVLLDNRTEHIVIDKSITLKANAFAISPDFNKSENELKTDFNALATTLPNDATQAWKILKLWIETHNPQFIEPYVIAWNIYSSIYKFSSVSKINDSRKRKFRTRIRANDFKFFDILSKASKSDFLKNANWFNFDWIIENEMNYLQILEGKYK